MFKTQILKAINIESRMQKEEGEEVERNCWGLFVKLCSGLVGSKLFYYCPQPFSLLNIGSLLITFFSNQINFLSKENIIQFFCLLFKLQIFRSEGKKAHICKNNSVSEKDLLSILVSGLKNKYNVLMLHFSQ